MTGGSAEQAVEVRACEGSAVELACTGGQTINIVDATYGRRDDATVCPHSAVSN